MAPDAELGERDLRLITPGGISNRVRFFIGALPEINEVEPNTDRAKPQALAALPVLINGQILDNDRDNFRFAAKAGQTIVCDVQARTLLAYLPDTVPGFLDTCLTLFDPSGKVLASVDRFRHKPDSRVGVHDSAGRRVHAGGQRRDLPGPGGFHLPAVASARSPT